MVANELPSFRPRLILFLIPTFTDYVEKIDDIREVLAKQLSTAKTLNKQDLTGSTINDLMPRLAQALMAKAARGSGGAPTAAMPGAGFDPWTVTLRPLAEADDAVDALKRMRKQITR